MTDVVKCFHWFFLVASVIHRIEAERLVHVGSVLLKYVALTY